MAEILWTPVAQSDLDDILYYIACTDGRPETAIQVYNDIRDSIRHRVEHKIAGHRHPVAPKGWLYFQFKRWLIFYQTIPNGIEIMRVVDGVRDLPNTL